MMKYLHKMRIKRLLAYLLVFCFISNMSLGSVRANEVTEADMVIDAAKATESLPAEDLEEQPLTDSDEDITADTTEETSAQTEAESATDATDKVSTKASVFTYDTQPVSMEEIQALIDVWQAGEGAKPCWEDEVEESLMPAGWRCDYLTDDATGAVYWSFFPKPQVMNAAVTDEAGLQAEINAAVAAYADGDTTPYEIDIANNIVLTGALCITGPTNITFASNGAVKLTAASGFRHITANSITGDIALTFEEVTLDGGFTNTGETAIMGGITADLSGILTLRGAVIQNCCQYNADEGYYGYGGGVYVEGGLELVSSTISNNVSGYGGGIYSRGNLTISDSNIDNNTAEYDGGGILGYGDIMISGGTVSSNTATYSYGGGICRVPYDGRDEENCSDGKTITLSDVIISGNTSKYDGGGVYCMGSVIISDSAEISGNTAVEGSGGGIYCGDYDYFDGESWPVTGGDVTLISGTISSNSAKRSFGGGGGVYCTVKFQMYSGEISDNVAALEDDYGNRYGSGGGVYCAGDVDIQDGIISGNEAAENGGGVYAHTMYYYADISDISVKITGGTISSNKAAAGNGGGVFSGFPLTLDSGIIKDNTAGTYGGGIYASAVTGVVDDASASAGGVSVIIKRGEVRYNTAVSGGGIYLSPGIAEVAPSRIHAPSGGAGSISIEGGNIHHNDALGGTDPDSGNPFGGDGGGIYSMGDVSVTGGNIYENTAVESGGGIYISMKTDRYGYPEGSAELLASGGAIRDNKAKNGGGIYSADGCSQEEYVYDYDTDTGEDVDVFYGAFITIEASAAITGNTASADGGGIYGNCDITMTGGTVSGNTAANGGGIYGPRRYIETQVDIGEEEYGYDDDGNWYWNWIADYVPVYYNNPAVFTISGSAAISGNTATVSGGGVYSGGDTTMTGGTVSGNRAVTGGGFYAVAGDELAGYELNTDYEYEPTTFAFTGAVLTISGSAITGNTSTLNGGGFYLEEKDASITDTAVTDAQLVTSGTSIANNHAYGEGGGIYTEAYDNYGSLDTDDYQNISTDGTTAFGGNTAAAAYDSPAIASSYTKILFSSVSASSHPINNYDINYIGTSSTEYTVNYDPNGGTGSVYAKQVTAGGSHTVLDNATDANLGYTRSGYEFTGWNTVAGGGGTAYAAGNMITDIAASMTLYAQWKELTGEIIKITVDIGDVYWWVPANDNEGSTWQGTSYNEVSAASPEGGWQSTEKGKIYAPAYHITNNSDFAIDVSVYSFTTGLASPSAGDTLNLNIKWNDTEHTEQPLVSANSDLLAGTTVPLTTDPGDQLTEAGGTSPTATFSFAGTWTGTYQNIEIPYDQTMVLNFRKAP